MVDYKNAERIRDLYAQLTPPELPVGELAYFGIWNKWIGSVLSKLGHYQMDLLT